MDCTFSLYSCTVRSARSKKRASSRRPTFPREQLIRFVAPSLMASITLERGSTDRRFCGPRFLD